MTSDRREQLIEASIALFNREGYHATGIDRILAEAGVAKMTLYSHFRSKEELILAALRRRDETFRNGFMRAVEKRAKAPRDRLLALFDVLGEWFASRDFFGCMFINACGEFADRAHPVHAAVAEHKRLLLAYIRTLAADAGARDPEALAKQLHLLVGGAIVHAHVAGDATAARDAKAAAAVLLAHAGVLGAALAEDT